MSLYLLDKLIPQTRKLAADYYQATGRPLGGVSGEIAAYDAARLLGLELCDPRPPGYDALGRGTRAGKRVQIKGRTIYDEGKAGHRLGQLKIEQEWDSVILVLMDENLQAYEIYEAERADVLQALAENQSNRAKRGAMSVAKFKYLSRLVWARGEGTIEDEVWDNQVAPPPR